MDALDDSGRGVMLRDARSEARGIPVAFRDEDRAGAGEVRWRFSKRAAREKLFVAERLLAIDENDIPPSSGEFPILEPVVEEEGIAAELLDRVPTAFDAVFVDQDDDVLEVGREHVRFISG